MDPFAQSNTSKNKVSPQQNNSFANALAELERPLGDATQGNQGNQGNHQDQNSLFGEALARAGGNFGDLQNQMGEYGNTTDFAQALSGINQAYGENNQPYDVNNQTYGWNNQPHTLEDRQKQIELEHKKAQKEALRKKLHDQLHPVETHNIFSAKQRRVQEDLEATRREIKQLAIEISKLHRDIDIAASQSIVTPGDDGTYYVSFFQKLRNFIMLLRQKVKSARSWAQQANAKKAKMKQKKTPGLEISGSKPDQTKAVFDMMNLERSSTYGGS
jgi:hypothetical protein